LTEFYFASTFTQSTEVCVGKLNIDYACQTAITVQRQLLDRYGVLNHYDS
jgi:hypothetical protein